MEETTRATTAAMPEDFHALLQYADDVASEPSPETAPYTSHYRALEILQKLLTTLTSQLEIALVNAKLGALYLHVEEPHKLLAFAAMQQQNDEGKEWTKREIDALLEKLPEVRIHKDQEEYTSNVLELLNQLGILWSNRAIPVRALCFFRASEQFCASQERSMSPNKGNTADEEDDSSFPLFRDVRAHANFYLAQVYGSLNMPDESAQCCLATLELQLRSLVLSPPSSSDEDDDSAADGDGDDDDVEGAQDWVKNCLRLVDYYLAADNLKDSATCLRACEYLLSIVIREGTSGKEEHENLEVQRAEIQLNWAKLHHLALKIAQFRQEGFEPSAPLARATAAMENTLAKAALLKRHSSAAAAAAATPSETQLNEYVPYDTITSFDIARKVFKMGMSACERAKKVFILDGFVTQHVRILQLESLFYKRLLHFEPDLKRQIAMHLRRLGILSPILQEQLNPDAYCALLQEVCYECAEVAAEIYDLKQEKKHATDDKTNAYALKAINWYQQYLLLFYSTAAAAAGETQQQKQQQLLSGTAVQLPSGSMSADEFRSVLLGYFGLARVCGRLQFPLQKEKTVLFWKQSLAYHQAVLELVKKYEQKEHPQQQEQGAVALHELFHAELSISKEMAELLPEKINQLVYNDKLL